MSISARAREEQLRDPPGGGPGSEGPSLSRSCSGAGGSEFWMWSRSPAFTSELRHLLRAAEGGLLPRSSPVRCSHQTARLLGSL